MKTTLLKGRNAISSYPNLTSLLRRNLKALILAVIMLAPISNSLSAQTEPEIIKGWSQLPEAEFFFDSAYAVLKCDSEASPKIVLEVFNEGGNVNSISFEITIMDHTGTTSEITVPKFDIAPSKYLRFKCGDPELEFLSFDIPEGIDATTLFIKEFKYIK